MWSEVIFFTIHQINDTFYPMIMHYVITKYNLNPLIPEYLPILNLIRNSVLQMDALSPTIGVYNYIKQQWRISPGVYCWGTNAAVQW